MEDVVTRISVRDFTRKIYKYMKAGEYMITKGGEDRFVVTIKDINVVTTNVMTKKADNVVTKADVPFSVPFKERYGCGCRVVEGKKICIKHGRA